MNTTSQRAIAMLTMLAMPALGQTTTIEVPQGSGAFPTVGQIKCLEDVGGRYCAATWTCGDESGVLWGDMANNDGRRPLGIDSPVARALGCTIEVDGEATVTWYRAFVPEDAPVGMSPVMDAPRPVIQRPYDGVARQSGSLVEWMAAEHGLDIAQARRNACGHLREDASQEHWNRCSLPVDAKAAKLLHLMATPFTMCAVDLIADLIPAYHEVSGQGVVDDTRGNAMLRSDAAATSPEMLSGEYARFAFGKCEQNFGGAYQSFARRFPDLRAQQQVCCELYREEAARVGLVFE